MDATFNVGHSLDRIQRKDSHHPDASHLRQTLSVSLAVDIGFVEIVDQSCCRSWVNGTKVYQVNRNTIRWQKREDIVDTTEMAKVVIGMACHSKPRLTYLASDGKTELHMLSEHSCQIT